MQLRSALREATARFVRAGIASGAAEAEFLAAHLMGIGLGELRAAALRGAVAPHRFAELVERRVCGEPVQHITGRAYFRHLELAVGPGVFVPRPETELLAQTVIDACRPLRRPLVVDLCTGSGAIAAAVASEVPHARVVAVEIDPRAAGYAAMNLAERPDPALQGVRLEVADATSPAVLADLDGTVDVVVSNPPYLPDDADVTPEAGQDPSLALYGGPRGHEVAVRVAARARTLLVPGGLLVLEHHDRGRGDLLGELANLGYNRLAGHADLTGRPRFVTAHSGADLPVDRYPERPSEA